MKNVRRKEVFDVNRMIAKRTVVKKVKIAAIFPRIVLDLIRGFSENSDAESPVF
jgi:hypothetical protein